MFNFITFELDVIFIYKVYDIMTNPNNYLKQQERALTRKLEIIESKGGKCERCGYDENIAALEFHHLDPSKKSFQMDSRHLSNTTIEKLLEEADKCILVCANCHREIHNGHLNKSNIPNLLNEMTSKHIKLTHIYKSHKMNICKRCGKEFPWVDGKIYCSDECREKDKNYPSYEEITNKHNELHSWEKVAEYYGVTRKILSRIRRINKI